MNKFRKALVVGIAVTMVLAIGFGVTGCKKKEEAAAPAEENLQVVLYVN